MLLDLENTKPKKARGNKKKLQKLLISNHVNFVSGEITVVKKDTKY